MSLRDWIHRVTAPRATSPQPWDDFWYGDAGGVTTESGLDISCDGSLKTSAVYACVRILAESVATVPLHLYVRSGDGGRERATRHPVYEILHDRPNGWQSPLEFREMLQMHVALRGNGYALIVPGRRGWVDELLPLHPDRVRVMVRTTDRKLVYEYTDVDGISRRAMQGEVLHVRGPSLDGYVGITPVAYARETIGRQMSMERANARFHRNDATPRVALVHPSKFKDDAAQKRLAASWNAAYGGSANAHKVAILEEGMDVKALGLKPEDAQFVQSWEVGLADVARWFGVHPRKIGAKSGDSQTYANVENAQIEHLNDTVRPWAARWEQAINRDLLLESERSRYYAEFQLEAVLRADHQGRAAYYEKAFGRWMTANEIRQRENLPPIDGGDELEEMNPEPEPAPPVPDPAEPEDDMARSPITINTTLSIPPVEVRIPPVEVRIPAIEVVTPPPNVIVEQPKPTKKRIKRMPDGSFVSEDIIDG